MILVCPENPSSWSKRPVTWGLLGLNIFIFVLFFCDLQEMGAAHHLRPSFLKTAGTLYLRHLDPSKNQPAWISDLHSDNGEQMETLGGYAIRDRDFLKLLSTLPPEGDAVAMRALQEMAKKFQEDLTDQPLHRFGLSSTREKTLAWVTYQFSHVSWLHLLSNMIFLVFIGLAIEGSFGGLTLLLIYLFGGLAGGVLFLVMNPSGIVPMVGASGCVSAMISFYAFAEPRRRIRYYYFLLPFKDLQGFIFLPTLLIVPLYMLADFTGLISAPAGLMSGVAYAAHVGGAVFGALVALNLRIWSRLRATV